MRAYRISNVLSVDEDGNGAFRTGIVATDFNIFQPEELDELVNSLGRRVAVFEIANLKISGDKLLDEDGIQCEDNLTFAVGTRVTLTNATIDRAICVRSPVPDDTKYFSVIQKNDAILAVYNYDRAFGIVEYLRYVECVDCEIAIVACGEGDVEPTHHVEITSDGRVLNYYQRDEEYDEVPCVYVERCNGETLLVDAAAID